MTDRKMRRFVKPLRTTTHLTTGDYLIAVTAYTLGSEPTMRKLLEKGWKDVGIDLRILCQLVRV